MNQKPSGIAATGQCSQCGHARTVRNKRGAEFMLCHRAAHDSAFERYPSLPMRDCPGFNEVGVR